MLFSYKNTLNCMTCVITNSFPRTPKSLIHQQKSINNYIGLETIPPKWLLHLHVKPTDFNDLGNDFIHPSEVLTNSNNKRRRFLLYPRERDARHLLATIFSRNQWKSSTFPHCVYIQICLGACGRIYTNIYIYIYIYIGIYIYMYICLSLFIHKDFNFSFVHVLL